MLILFIVNSLFMRYTFIKCFLLLLFSCGNNSIPLNKNLDVINKNKIEYYANGRLKEVVFNIENDTLEIGDIEVEEVYVYVIASYEGYKYWDNEHNTKMEYYKVINKKNEGEWLFWDEHGVLICSETYSNDVLLHSIEH